MRTISFTQHAARIAGFLSLGVLAALTTRADTLVDDFDGKTSFALWAFSNGPEFPGAVGAFTLTQGRAGNGQAGRLSFDLSKGGNYTSAGLSLSTPTTAEAIRFWARSPSNINISLRVLDSAGQTLQYNLHRPLDAAKVSDWYQHTVSLDSPHLWFGGPADGILRNPIRRITFLADKQRTEASIGSIEIDDIETVSSAHVTLNLARGILPAPEGSADLLSRMGVNVHFTDDDRALDAAKSAGFSWIRNDLQWSAIERTKGIYDWSAFDRLVAALKRRDMKALFILGYGNPIYTGENFLVPPTSDTAMQAYGEFAKAAAAHFAGTGTRFEIWNEANIAPYWHPKPDPLQYAKLASLAVNKVHEGDRFALVSTTGMSGFDFAFAREFLSTGLIKGPDAIGVHPYDIKAPGAELIEHLLHLRQIVDSHLPSAPPIWDTEWGFSSTHLSGAQIPNGHDDAARTKQASLTVRRLLSACAAGLPLYINYELRDGGTNPAEPEHNFGLLAYDYSEKPAMRAVKQLSSVARGRRYVGLVPVNRSGLTAMRFEGSTDTVVALWTSAPNGRMMVSLAGSNSVMDYLGNPVPTENGTFLLAEQGGPVYVSFSGSSWLSNLSVLTDIDPKEGPLVAGFFTAGTSSKALLVRAVGPALSYFGVSSPLLDPELVVVRENAESLGRTVGWAADLAPVFSRLGAFALTTGSRDAAVLQVVAPGGYTAQIRSSSVAMGTAIAEVYDADEGAPATRLVNLSARANVSTAGGLTGGFVISGKAHAQILIRGVGPALGLFGVNNALRRPTLTVYNSSRAIIATNTGWQSAVNIGGGAVANGPQQTIVTQATASSFASVGAFQLPSGSGDCAVALVLPPGAYTAQIAGQNGETGVGLIEIYEIKQ